MEWFVLIISVALLIYIFKSKNKGIVNVPKGDFEKYFKTVKSKNNYIYKIPIIKYNNKCIKRFEISGMNFRKLKKNNVGYFKGYVIIEKNKHDPYAIAIYTNKGVHIGYLPGGSEKRFNTINKKPHKATFAWGLINSNPNTNHFFGFVYVTMCLSEEETELIKNKQPLELLTNQNL